ncbi:MAG: hypothetical protein ACPGD5_07795 [Salibacteraceae bacterium]
MYATKGYCLKYNWPNFSGGPDIEPFVLDKSVRESTYLEIPWEVTYKVLDKDKLDLRVVTGGVYSGLIKETAYGIKEDGSRSDEDFIRSFKEASNVLFQWRLGMDVTYAISKSFDVTFYPYFTKSFINLNDEVIENPPFGMGGQLVVAYKIKGGSFE